MFINIGFGNFVNSDLIVAISRADSAPARRLISSAKESHICVDCTQGRKTKTVITAMNGQVILSALTPETVTGRLHSESTGLSPEEEELDERQ
ncbi:MAG: DUF370 domain-containing protein [Lachnospiraceae bacterium]|jgi:regulator of extracellular matrix RemA (YlzA/DUF370 family)